MHYVLRFLDWPGQQVLSRHEPKRPNELRHFLRIQISGFTRVMRAPEAINSATDVGVNVTDDRRLREVVEAKLILRHPGEPKTSQD
jgi:hypothetical protein